MTLLSKKVCLLGEFAVGKTSLVQRFVYNRFNESYVSTVGVKVSHKTIAIPSGNSSVELSLMLWDLAGGAEFEGLRASYLRATAGAILVCDLTRANTLHCIEQYVNELRSTSPHASMVLVGNKSDLTAQHRIAPEILETYAQELGVPCYCTSAKLGTNVSSAFRQLGQMMNTEAVGC